MTENRISILAAQAHGRMDSRLSVVVLILAVLVLAGGVTRMFGLTDPPALDPETEFAGP